MSHIEWSQLKPPISEDIIKVLFENNYRIPTPVQVSSVPAFLSRKDVAVEAVTGSGKTLAFLVPIFQMLYQSEEKLRETQIGALILEPTRELALQTYITAKPFAEKLGFTMSLMVGGSTTDSDELSKSGSNIVIGTPGRVAHSISMFLSSIRSLEVLILDEADRLYSLGQAETVRSIIAMLPKQRRTGLFSATLEDSAEAMNEAGMRNPITIKLQKQSNCLPVKTPEGLTIFYAKVQASDKLALLLSFLKSKLTEKHIIFFSTCAAVEYFSAVLRELLGDKMPVFWIHGKIDKLSRREKVFSRFKSNESHGAVLISTDLMSRGIDFPDVDWVTQFDPPSSPATFVHRCGRTARMNKVGNALLFLMPNEMEYVRFIDKNQSVKMTAFNTNSIAMLNADEVLHDVRQLSLQDRDLYDKSSRAFVSFIQFYRKHECSLIFQLKELEIGQLGYSYGLLQMPKMPEIRSFAAKTGSFKNVEGVDFNAIAFKDSNREKQRLESLKRRAETKQAKPKEVEPKLERKKLLKKKLLKEKKKKLKSKKRAEEDSDWEELAKDALLIKRLKTGKMSERDFERAMGLSSDDD